MQRRFRLLLAVACALSVMSLAGGTSMANRLSVDTIPFILSFSPMFSNELVTVSCDAIIFTGAFHRRTFTKTPGLLLGTITEVAIESPETCEGGTVILLNETLPWHFRYVSYTGTLPNITLIDFHIVGATMGATALGVTCLYRTTAANPAGIEATLEAGGRVTAVTADSSLTIPTITPGLMCQMAGDVRVSGTGSGGENVSFFLI
jgi:hypothetical protein